jgi:hypothetical protein
MEGAEMVKKTKPRDSDLAEILKQMNPAELQKGLRLFQKEIAERKRFTPIQPWGELVQRDA